MTTPRIEEINERIKKTHLDCECCRNWTRITELKEAEAHQAGYADGYKQGKFDAEMTVEYGEPEALQDNK